MSQLLSKARLVKRVPCSILPMKELQLIKKQKQSKIESEFSRKKKTKWWKRLMKQGMPRKKWQRLEIIKTIDLCKWWSLECNNNTKQRCKNKKTMKRNQRGNRSITRTKRLFWCRTKMIIIELDNKDSSA